MMSLQELTPDPKSRKKPKRVGRGEGSGMGKTCSRGQKGQKSRSGAKIGPHFEGGQMPIQRRLPKFGFRSPHGNRKHIAVVNVQELNRFPEGEEVHLQSLHAKGFVAKGSQTLRILGKGKLNKKLTIKAHYFSPSAEQKIKEANGTIEVIA